eukprot:52165_1
MWSHQIGTCQKATETKCDPIDTLDGNMGGGYGTKKIKKICDIPFGSKCTFDCKPLPLPYDTDVQATIVCKEIDGKNVWVGTGEFGEVALTAPLDSSRMVYDKLRRIC